MTEIDVRLSRRRFLQASAAVGATVGLGGIAAACSVGSPAAQGGTFNWMTWGDHYIDTQLKAIEASDKIVPQISELAGNAEGFAKLKEVKGELDQISGDALWVPDAYYAEGLIEPFDINELKVASQLYSFAREFEIWTKPEGYLGYPFGWSPISIYYNVEKVTPAPDSWEVLLDPKYKGRIVIENQPEEIVAYMGKASGVDDVYNMTDDQLATVKGLLEQLKPNVLKFAQQATDSVNSMTSAEAWLITGNFGNEDRVKDAGGPGDQGLHPEGRHRRMDGRRDDRQGGQEQVADLPVPREVAAGREHRRELHHARPPALQRAGLQGPRGPGPQGPRRPISLQRVGGDPGPDHPEGAGHVDGEVDPALQRGLRSLVATHGDRRSSAGPAPGPADARSAAGASPACCSSHRSCRRGDPRRPVLRAAGVDVRLLALVDRGEPRHRPRLDARELPELLPRTRPTSGPCSRRCVIGAGVTVVSLVVAFVVAYFLSRYVSRRWARIALLVIIVPFWTSYLLRVYSWQAILGERGALNQVLIGLGILREPSFLFVYNDFGTFLVLVYLYIPFAALVLYASLERFDFTQLTAAQDLGAQPRPRVPPCPVAADPPGPDHGLHLRLHPDPR